MCRSTSRATSPWIPPRGKKPAPVSVSTGSSIISALRGASHQWFVQSLPAHPVRGLFAPPPVNCQYRSPVLRGCDVRAAPAGASAKVSVRAACRCGRKGQAMLSEKIGKAALAPALLCLVAGFFSAVIAPARADNPQQSAISEEASAAIARMSKTLSAKQFSFDARTFRSYVGANGELLHISHTMTTIFRRPDRLSLDVSGDDGSIKLRRPEERR